MVLFATYVQRKNTFEKLARQKGHPKIPPRWASLHHCRRKRACGTADTILKSCISVVYATIFNSVFFFFSPHLLSSPSLSLFHPINSRNSDQGSHLIAGSFSPLPSTVRALHFYRGKTSALSSLVDSRQIVLTHARRSQHLILLFFLQINSDITTAGFELQDEH